MDLRCGELEHPADVGRGHEMPGGPEQVGAEDGAAIERVLDHRVGALHDALADGPLGTG